jgi:hypothetical protein
MFNVQLFIIKLILLILWTLSLPLLAGRVWVTAGKLWMKLEKARKLRLGPFSFFIFSNSFQTLPISKKFHGDPLENLGDHWEALGEAWKS